MQQSMEFSNSLNGMEFFLRQCPSKSMAVSVGLCIHQAIQANQLDPSAPLTHESLEAVRQNLYKRNDANPSNGKSDSLFMLFDTIGWVGGGSSSSDPFESRLLFVECLQAQLRDGGRINFQRAFSEANRR